MTRPIEAETKQVKRDVKKIDAALDRAAKKAKTVQAKTKTAEELADEAEKKLLQKCPKNEERVAELKLEAEAEAKKACAKGGHHHATAPAFDAMKREGTDVLPYNHPACLGGAKIAQRDLTKERLEQANKSLRERGGKGKYAGHLRTKEDMSLVGKQKYTDHAEQGNIGLAGHNAEKEKNMDKRIQEAARTIEFVEMFQNEEGEKIGFDLKPNVE